MAVTFTKEQQETIDARNASILVSAAAGSGKTAVLVERIIQMVKDPVHPVDIDRLLVVTFTSAAAAQMRERISQALSDAVDEQPENAHLTRQLTLIHHAQITTIDSFCLYLIRNHFDEIGLDPDFRVADEGEVRLLKRDVLDGMLEEYFAGRAESLADDSAVGAPADGDVSQSAVEDKGREADKGSETDGAGSFQEIVEYFSPQGSDRRLEEQLLSLYDFAMSYPWPEEWLKEHQKDYDVPEGGLDACPWVGELKSHVKMQLSEAGQLLEQALSLCREPDGPYMYLDTLLEDQERVEELSRAEGFSELYEGFSSLSFGRISSKKDAAVSQEKRERAKELRGTVKDLLTGLKEKYFYASPESQEERMRACAPLVKELLELALDFCRRFSEKKRERGILDFHDMEHLALQILICREDGKLSATRTARQLRETYEEIMIDEYQDSNLVQEYLLLSISGEEDGRYNRFMVGDVKQSIYKFRLARPELFMEKFDRYRRLEAAQDGEIRERRIDLKKNFRSRRQVTDSVNGVFSCLMGKDLGGVAYDADAALYPGAVFPDPVIPDAVCQEGSPEDGEESGTSEDGEKSGTSGPWQDPCRTEVLLCVPGEDGMEEKEREAMAVAGRIRELVGRLPVVDGETKELRPARYSDMVILLRSPSGWDETFKKVLETCGIPVYISSRTGYFAATEVQTVLNFLRVLNNPLQDIPLFGVLKSPAAGFSDREIALIRAKREKGRLYESLCACAQEEQETEKKTEEAELRAKAQAFLALLERFRDYAVYLPIHELIREFLEQTGYLYTASALPGGEQRRANLEMLLSKAESFEKTSYFGLFHFIRYMEQVEKYDIDYGEASLQDENADTVRIMSIHRSKGLEFPICFVSGLGKRFNMQDIAKPVIVDMDLGVGLDYVDSVMRVKRGTLKKNVMAGRLQRDSLGEELRVLYVAMTRAQEKLILTGGLKAERAEKLKEEIEKAAVQKATGQKATGQKATALDRNGGTPGAGPDSERLLPFFRRSGASSYLDWLLPAWQQTGQKIELVDASRLLTGQMEKEQNREKQLQGLKQFLETEPVGTEGKEPQRAEQEPGKKESEEKEPAEAGVRGQKPESGEADAAETAARDAAARLSARLKSGYPHRNLERLYTKTTVSELKKAGMAEAAEEAYHLFEEEEVVPYLPRFVRSEDKMGGAARGSAYHKALELFPFGSWMARKDAERGSLAASGQERACSGKESAGKNCGPEAAGTGADRKALEALLDEMREQGRLLPEYREAVSPWRLEAFLKSALAARMGRADTAGLLHKEQPFVLGIPASELGADFPEEETVLIQGIIDVYFEEDGELVVADYKTDAVTQAEELVNRYRVQLDYYARALEQLTRKRVKEKIIYSFALQKEIVL